MTPFRTASLGFLMLRTMFHAAVERLSAHETLTARQVDATMSASHHVLALDRCVPGPALDLLLVAFQYPVDQSKTREKQENFGQTAVRF
jgi:hypothetical protein